MLNLSAGVKIWLYGQPTDMRKSFTGLVALVKNAMGENPLQGNVFVFINRRKTQLKMLYFDRSGFCIWMKRLEEGSFQYPAMTSDKVELDRVTLNLILEGIDLKHVKKRKRYQHELLVNNAL